MNEEQKPAEQSGTQRKPMGRIEKYGFYLLTAVLTVTFVGAIGKAVVSDTRSSSGASAEAREPTAADLVSVEPEGDCSTIAFTGTNDSDVTMYVKITWEVAGYDRPINRDGTSGPEYLSKGPREFAPVHMQLYPGESLRFNTQTVPHTRNYEQSIRDDFGYLTLRCLWGFNASADPEAFLGHDGSPIDWAFNRTYLERVR